MQCAIPSLLLCIGATTGLVAQPSLTIALYDSVGLAQKTREAAKIETARILLGSGISTVWIECEIDGRLLEVCACAVPLSVTRIMLQFLPGRNPKNDRIAGMAVRQNGRFLFACVYPERVRELSRDGNWDFGDLLGHAAAHEIGHLLLETFSHSSAGIMRARWETEDLRRLSHSGLVFLPNQLAGAQARLHASGHRRRP